MFAIITTTSYSQFLKELNLNDRLKNSSSTDLDEDFGFSNDSEIPTSYSLEQYAVVAKQNGQSCTGFAISGAMTIMYNKINGIDRYTQKLINRFDPFFIYSSIKDLEDVSCVSGDGCGCPTYIYQGLDIVENYGCKKWYLTPDISCSSVLSTSILRDMSEWTGIYKIDSYSELLDYSKDDNGDWFMEPIDIDRLKFALSLDLPIIAGIDVGNEFSNVKSPNTSYAAEEESVGGHAITIVGYNDYHKGGSFRILNSYGRDWGEDGFFWMSYKDFKKSASSSYVIFVDDNHESWVKSHSKSSFYKGNLTNDLKWEGPMDAEGNCNGRGILTGEDFTAYAYYSNGKAYGEWHWFGDGDDGFWGTVTYDNGIVVSKEEFGFSSNQNKDAQINLIQIDNMDINISEEANDDDFTPAILDRISNNSSVSKRTNFNFNKTNNYNKE